MVARDIRRLRGDVLQAHDGKHAQRARDDQHDGKRCQQQVVIKSLETHYGRIDGVSGATILGDGCVSLILDLPGLIRAASMSYAA